MELSVIVVSYNTKNLLKQCLASVFKYTKGINFEVLVIDNASEDDSAAMIKKDFLQARLIENKKNLGFAAANNQGIKQAKGKYVLLLNSDTILKENSLRKMIDWMEKNKKVGVASCQLVYQDGSIQRTGGYFPNLLRIFSWMFFFDDLPLIKELIKPFHPHEPRTGWLSSQYFQKQHFQDWVTGAFFLVRKRVIDQIGLLDEKFFMYVEEVEFCYRAKKAGWQVIYLPITKIVHLALKSGTQAGARLGEYRGLIYFYKKHKPSWQLQILKIFLKTGALLRLLIFGIMKNDPEMRRIYAQAFKVN
jgi:GT2 family glycosyltransferase